MNARTEQSKQAEEEREAGSQAETLSGKQSGNGENGSIGELRRLLVGSEEISEVLPDAVARSSRKDSQLSDATLPIVEQNIRESVIRNPKILADALFPVIGPAIRKAISAALSTMVQSFNQTLEHSVSPKSIGWRLEAMRTGKSFGEVVMLKTLLYRVEQVFLIDKETGILLQHVAKNPQDTEDADMVSAMLTAISDFAHDSFKTTGDATLDSFNISGLSVWIEDSPDAILAAVIRGNPPLELRETFELAIEKVQFSLKNEFKNFEGDTGAFEPARPVLEECLVFQAGEEEGKKGGIFSPTNILAGVAGLLLLLVVGYFALDFWRWNGLLSDIRSEPGLVLTDFERGWFQHSVTGLRDPLAGKPADLLVKNGYDESDVALTWRQFQSDDEKFVLLRAGKMLRPPKGVELKFSNGVLTAEGAVPEDWSDEAGRLSGFIAGIDSFTVKDDGGAIVSEIESAKLMFECGSATIKPGSVFGETMEKMVRLSAMRQFTLEVTGHADNSGTSETNNKISLLRAETFAAELRKRLAKDGSSGRVKIENRASETGSECKVTFKVKPLN